MGVLLLGADYYGTLAAARCYGRNGIHVAMADQSRHARALFSRYAGERLVHPPLAAPAMLVDWLLRWGEQHPGTLLYPANDHLAWLFAAERDRLARVFRMLCPAEETVIALLDKKRLRRACEEVGIDVPDTHTLAEPSQGSASPVSDDLRYPLLLKPRTQVYLESGIKGLIVHDRAELATKVARFRKLASFSPVLTDRYPDIAEPIAQEYLPVAETSILSVSGFAGDDGEIVARAATKIFQRPRKVGIGMCFEGRGVEEPLVEQLSALCRHVGYRGAFESEFVAQGDRRLLIDFNPRFYSQMGFEVARGLPLPLLVWHAARGDSARLAEALARSRAWRPSGHEVYCHKLMLDLTLALQRRSGRMSRVDVARWRAWHDDAAHRHAATDAVRDPDDPRPAKVDALQWAAHFARHPRSFVRDYVLNR